MPRGSLDILKKVLGMHAQVVTKPSLATSGQLTIHQFFFIFALRYFQYSLQSSESVSKAVECVTKHVNHTTVFYRGLCTRGQNCESTAH